MGWLGLSPAHASHGHGELMDLFVQLGWQEWEPEQGSGCWGSQLFLLTLSPWIGCLDLDVMLAAHKADLHSETCLVLHFFWFFD